MNKLKLFNSTFLRLLEHGYWFNDELSSPTDKCLTFECDTIRNAPYVLIYEGYPQWTFHSMKDLKIVKVIPINTMYREMIRENY